MSRNLTERFLRETEQAINNAVSIADVSRAMRDTNHRKPVEYSADDLAWFRAPIDGSDSDACTGYEYEVAS